MPTYEYACDACEHQFEEFQSITAEPIKKCPECGKPKLRRIIGAGAAIIFKGSGFYQTDYRSADYKKAAKADSDSGASTKSEAKSDSSSPSTKSSDSKSAAPSKSD